MKRILGLAVLAASALGGRLVAGGSQTVLKFPKESDRIMVLMAGTILILGMVLMLYRLRRGAERRSGELREEKKRVSKN